MTTQGAILTAALLIVSLAAPLPAQQAKWTVMVYLNADNNLEADGLLDFQEMANVGSTNDVNILVQFDRIGKYTVTKPTNPQWSDTLRFRVTKNQSPTPNQALEHLGEVNMGKPEALRDFVKWGMSEPFKADRYALILWDHGDGWRLDLPPAPGDPSQKKPYRSTETSPHKALSHDETDDDKLHNREVQDVLEATLTRPLDLIGFDACLMSMIETTYAMRRVGMTMVASEELEPGTGWAYDRFLAKLVATPSMTPNELAIAIVDTYDERYRPMHPGNPPVPNAGADLTTTLSAIDLQKASAVADSLSDFAAALQATLPAEIRPISIARNKCKTFAPEKAYFHVDLIRFLDEYAARTTNATLRDQAKKVATDARKAVIKRWAGPDRATQGFGSHGIAIYFPKTGTAYEGDVHEEGAYRRENTAFPVAFVVDKKWSDFLHAYFPERTKCGDPCVH